MHARKTARDLYFPSRFDDAFFTARGDVTFKDTGEARRFADRINARDERGPQDQLRPAELAAMVLVHEIMHQVIGLYRKQNPERFAALQEQLVAQLGNGARETLLTFLTRFPTPAIYKHLQGEGEETAALALGRDDAQATYTEEVILLWLMNQNPAYEPVRPLVSDADLGDTYRSFVSETTRFFEDDAPFGPGGETLLDLLLAPSRKAPGSILEQLKYMEEAWGPALGIAELGIWRRVLWARDFLTEEGKYFVRGGPGPGAPVLDAMQFEARPPEEEPKRFSADLDWMPQVIILAKTVFVWLDQLSKKYQRTIERLDQIPDEELDLVASRGFTGLWLIGLFERSRASKKIKQMRGDQDAVASAYSLMKYDIADELGGYAAYASLKQRAWARGVRLAADMVPNHVGIDADWVIRHPDWFIQTAQPPFPGYRFGGADLSDDPRVGVFIEEGYWSKTDAAVVFRRHDRQTDENRFIYHGNDGTSMPWNDTAQLDYTKAEVRHAVIETILHVARMFPIIRFDAAMTLAKRHFSRLWFPLPGSGGAIPSRADHAMTQEEFDHVFPVEFWREVVDTVAARAPDTLLLAEAFWMMEGYFVRSLGMHRVYNSAFMNMLKREENDKYRQTIKNVLDFEPEILKRFVNFMNNPDEDTAVAQFGADDKYFGVCVLMCTMPGLPMFGHGQVEGLHEKYGMEYRRPRWDEPGNPGLVARHEREIFPVMKKRYLFSGVAEFSLYDFVAEGGGVDEDVYAYSNGEGSERALVLFNNKFKDTRGRIRESVPTRREDGSTTAPTIAEALGLKGARGEWMLFRDAAKGLEYVRPLAEIERGFFWELGAFKYHVLTEFRDVSATAERPYGDLAAALAGRGVPSIEEALVQLRFRPVHAPLAEALGEAHLAYLAGGWDATSHAPTKQALGALAERVGFFADGLDYLRGGATDRAPALTTLRKRYQGILAMAHATALDPTSVHACGATSLDVPLLLAWAQVDAAIDLLSAPASTKGESPEAGPAKTALANDDATKKALATSPTHAVGTTPDAASAPSRDAVAERWQLAYPLTAALGSSERAALVLLATTLAAAPLREELAAALLDPRGQAVLGVHDADGVSWLAKERFTDVATFLAHRAASDGRTSAALSAREVADAERIAAKEGYRAMAIRDALMARPEAVVRADHEPVRKPEVVLKPSS